MNRLTFRVSLWDKFVRDSPALKYMLAFTAKYSPLLPSYSDQLIISVLALIVQSTVSSLRVDHIDQILVCCG